MIFKRCRIRQGMAKQVHAALNRGGCVAMLPYGVSRRAAASSEQARCRDDLFGDRADLLFLVHRE